MYCPNCNAQLPDGAAFCGHCGQTLNNTQQPAAPIGYAPPQYPGYPSYPTRPVVTKSKKEYLATDASESARSQSKLVLLTALISVALIIAGIVATMTMSIFDIPVMAMLMEAAGADADTDELMDELEDSIDQMEEEYELIEDDFSKDEQKDIEKWMDTANDLADTFSISNLNAFVKETDMIVDEYGDEFYTEDLEDIAEGMDAVNQLMAGIIIFVVGFFFLPVLFAILGGTLKNTALTVVGIVFTAIAQVTFCGLLWVVLSLAVGIVQAVLCSKINAEYRDYQMGKIRA